MPPTHFLGILHLRPAAPDAEPFDAVRLRVTRRPTGLLITACSLEGVPLHTVHVPYDVELSPALGIPPSSSPSS